MAELNVEGGNHIIISCPLCKERGLHVIGTSEVDETRQCLNCGFVTAPKFKCEEDKKEENISWSQLTDEMREWSQYKDGFIWIPTIMTLPFGMLYPFTDEDKGLRWGFAHMIDIPKEKQKEYPREDGEGFYAQRFDTENAVTYDAFVECMSYVNEYVKKVKEENKDA